jgi:hypothetical protein
MQELMSLGKPRAKTGATSTRALGSVAEREELRQRGGGVDIKEAKRVLPKIDEAIWIDQFPYFPSYKYHAYRSGLGATCSILMGFIFFLRLITSVMDFNEQPPVLRAPTGGCARALASRPRATRAARRW